MNRRGYLWSIVLLTAVAMLAGCERDPNVRKQKYYESGLRYSAAGKYREAAIQFSNALKIDNSYADAHYGLAQAYLNLGQFSAADGELVHTVDLQPTNYKARLDLGNLLLANGNTEMAQEEAFAVLAAEPNSPDVHAMLSAIAVRHGETDQALVEIQRALELDPNRAEFHANLALLQANDPTKTAVVEDELKKSVALDPKSVNAKLLLVEFYTKGNRWPQAEQMSWDAVATDPKSIAARVGLAGVFLKEGDSAKAEEALRKASQDLADDPQGLRLLADYYASSGQWDKAKAEFLRLVQEHPKNLYVREGYIRVLFAAKEYGTAQSEVADLMKKNAKDPEVMGLNGIVLLNEGQASDAVIAIQGAVKDAPQDDFLQYWLGRAALAKGDMDLAEKSLRVATSLNPSSLPAEQELAQIASQRGDMNLLADVAEKTVYTKPRLPEGYVWRAQVEMTRNAADKAEADLKKAMEVAPQDSRPYLELGTLRFEQKRFPEGVSLLEEALLRDPNSYEALRLLVSYDLSEKQADKALARLNAQIDKSPQNSSFYDLLAQFEMENKNLDKAAAAAQKAIQMDAGDGEAVMIFAQIQVLRGQTANAVAAWEGWLRTHPNDAGATAVLGMIEESSGNLGKAEVYYRKSLQIQPQQPLASNNLAYLMLQHGENVDVALTLAQTARRAMPNSPSTADTLAWAYYHKGTYSFARDLLESAVKTEPNDAAMQYHLGMVYGKLRDKSNAAAHLKKAVSMAPDSPTAKDARAALQGLG